MSKIPPVLLLLGPERGEKDAFIQSLLKTIRTQTKDEPEIHKLYSFERSIHDALSILRNGSLFTRSRVVFFEGVDSLKRKDELEPLLQYIRAPAPDSVLLLLSDRPSVEKRLQDALPENQKKIFWELFENQKKEWIQNFFQKEGISISPEGVDILLELVENNTRDLRQVSEQLADFFREKGRILAEDIEQFLYHSKQETVFTLFERVLEGRLEASFEILHKLLLEGEIQAVGILISLTYQLRTLRDYLHLRKENYSPQEAYGKLRILGKRTQRAYAMGEKTYSLDQAEQMVALCADFDEYLRAYRTDFHMILLELFLYGLIQKKGKSPLSGD
ncbi:MAG: DNA polymerase III subunit delta [Spirochaetes bacterium]|nr:DNA polymerase III subunit delta [Spirochaetota bacterium]